MTEGKKDPLAHLNGVKALSSGTMLWLTLGAATILFVVVCAAHYAFR